MRYGGGWRASTNDKCWSPKRLLVVTNWFEELREPTGDLTRHIPWLRVFVEGVVIVGELEN